ncbi:MAG: AAA family ATPase [Wolbachia sp.]
MKTYGVFCEDNKEKLRHRKSAINEFYQLSMESPDLAHNVRLFPRIGKYSLLMTFNDENVSRLTSYFYELLKDIQLFQPRLVVLDSTSSLFWGDENNRFHLEQFIIGCCVHIAREANCAVLLYAHDK